MYHNDSLTGRLCPSACRPHMQLTVPYSWALCPQAKKVTRHLQRSAAGGHGYTNAENPFGDANVTQRFVWGKKIEKQLQEGADVRDLTARAERERQVERLVRGPCALWRRALQSSMPFFLATSMSGMPVGGCVCSHADCSGILAAKSQAACSQSCRRAAQVFPALRAGGR